ncbi:MAG: uncharacterized protein PWQ57_59 [Desulfovibrionales bacterium]|nr:uncharacterized protein [Desulfovibrionales bacterium]
MPYYLKCHFDPRFDPARLRPKELEDGSVDHYDLGYVQNVVMGEVIAELTELSDPDSDPGLDRKFVFEKKVFPAGPNTVVNPENDSQLLAGANGLVFMDAAGEIVVNQRITLNSDVDFHTGNIFFVGDLVVRGSLRSGFQVRAKNLLVRDLIEGAEVQSMQLLSCPGGVKGGSVASLKAGKSMKLGFAENAMLNAAENILIEKNAFHCKVYAGQKLAVKGRLIGGLYYGYQLVYVGEQLGGGMSAATQIIVGFDPQLLFEDQRMNEQLEGVQQRILQYQRQLERTPDAEEDLGPKLAKAEKKMTALTERKAAIWGKISATERLKNALVVCPGEVMPGVEISIGTSYLHINDYLKNVRFRLKDGEIVTESPALRK